MGFAYKTPCAYTGATAPEIEAIDIGETTVTVIPQERWIWPFVALAGLGIGLALYFNAKKGTIA